MNASAKMTTFSFLAAAALGAAVFTGCTVTSGTVDDVDGGSDDDDRRDAGGAPETGTGTPDSGGIGKTCTTPQTSDFYPAACQSCLETSCCVELNNCFSLPNDDDTLNCDGFKDCLDECAGMAEEEQEACYAECSEVLAAAGVVDAYRSIFACAEQSCAAECIEE